MIYKLLGSFAVELMVVIPKLASGKHRENKKAKPHVREATHVFLAF
jgi:hypothetical protein